MPAHTVATTAILEAWSDDLVRHLASSPGGRGRTVRKLDPGPSCDEFVLVDEPAQPVTSMNARAGLVGIPVNRVPKPGGS